MNINRRNMFLGVGAATTMVALPFSAIAKLQNIVDTPQITNKGKLIYWNENLLGELKTLNSFPNYYINSDLPNYYINPDLNVSHFKNIEFSLKRNNKVWNEFLTKYLFEDSAKMKPFTITIDDNLISLANQKFENMLLVNFSYSGVNMQTVAIKFMQII